MKVLSGTSGYSYKEWKGVFYPEKLAAKDMLAYYGEQLPAVEINNTFYRMPRVSVLESWRDQVPESFRFAIKASRRITHLKRLQDVGEETGYLLHATEALGSRLGVILFQTPPNLRADLGRLDALLALLPSGARAAFEFRHDSWNDPEVLGRLRERDLAWVHVDDDERDPEPLESTASWGYLRLRAAGYDREQLTAWAQRIAAQDWREVFVFFKHEDEASGPRMAREFLDLATRAAARRPPLGLRPRTAREAG